MLSALLAAGVGPGDEVAGATINASGRLVVRATRVGAETALAQIARLVADARSMPPAERSKRLAEGLALWRGPPLADLEFERFADVVLDGAPPPVDPDDPVANLEVMERILAAAEPGA